MLGNVLGSSYDGIWSVSNHSECCTCCRWLSNLRCLDGIERASDEGVDKYEVTPSNNRGSALGLRAGCLSTKTLI